MSPDRRSFTKPPHRVPCPLAVQSCRPDVLVRPAAKAHCCALRKALQDAEDVVACHGRTSGALVHVGWNRGRCR